MQISFIGQTRIFGEDTASRRIRALAGVLARRGHTVRLFSAVEKHAQNINFGTIQYHPSFNPTVPGGWLYAVLSVVAVLRHRPDVVHISSWKIAAFGSIISLFARHITLVWTVSAIPRKSIFSRFVMWQASRTCDAIAIPTRSLQWQLREEFGVLATYIPDGYPAPTLKDIPATTWKLRKGQYVAVLANTVDTAHTLCKAYKGVGSKKKFVIITREKTARLARLERSYPLVKVVEVTGNRQLSSLIRQASSVLVAREDTADLMLLAMDSGIPVVAQNLPLLQEIAGTTVQFFALHDTDYITALLREVVKQPYMVDTDAAQRRSRRHFTWNRVFEEYETLYHYPVVRSVPLDSIQAKRFTQSALY